MKIFSFLNKKKDFYSQSGQDQFAYNLVGTNGTYLEIGANHPIINSNTYNLETKCGWKGISIEFDISYKTTWAHCRERVNKIIWEDAFKIDFIAELNKYKLFKTIDYLSCDIEPPENTLKILKHLIKINLQFSFISFEHDKYQSGDKYENLSKEFLISNGYKIAVDNVYSRNKKNKIYETWFVKKNINFNRTEYHKWKMENFKNNIFKV